ncbi:MAG: hypothetical protein CM1200mP7_2880 [Chloroflexota bacterium]|nr:MAG: hypothetical protein CM1200mP7_2880 [Chloroflexota bacterium]
MTAADAIAAPVEPIVTDAFARPFLTNDVATKIDAFGFCLKANAGLSLSNITSSDGIMLILSLE